MSGLERKTLPDIISPKGYSSAAFDLSESLKNVIAVYNRLVMFAATCEKEGQAEVQKELIPYVQPVRGDYPPSDFHNASLEFDDLEDWLNSKGSRPLYVVSSPSMTWMEDIEASEYWIVTLKEKY